MNLMKFKQAFALSKMQVEMSLTSQFPINICQNIYWFVPYIAMLLKNFILKENTLFYGSIFVTFCNKDSFPLI